VSAASGTPDPDRVVETTCAPAGQTANPERGTGYLIAPRLVLTARHTVTHGQDAPGRIRVRQLSRTGDADWLNVEEVITSAGPGLDLALLLLDEDAPGVPDDPGVAAGIVDLATPLPFQACGFPKAHREGEERGDETARGNIRLDSGSRSATVPLDVTPAVPSAGRGAGSAPGEQRKSGWSGLSGAAVLGPGGLLVGLAVADHLKFEADRLEMIPVEALLSDETLSRYLPEAWRARPQPRVSNEVPLTIGARRIELAAPTPRRHMLRSGPRRVTTLLDGRSQIVPFVPRAPQQQWLRDWCETDPQPVSCAVLSGEGGAGKSRLARRLCDDLADAGWITGLVEPSPGSGFAAPFENAGRPALLVLDYADHRQEEVAELRNLLPSVGRSKVRVLAVVRDGPAFLSRLRLARAGNTDDVGQERHLALAARPLDGQEREQHYRAATRAFAEAQRMRLPAETGQQELERRLAAMTTPLLVHAAALLDLLDPGTSDVEGPEDVLRHLLNREDRSFWIEDFKGYLESRDTRRRVVAVSTLVGVKNPRDEENRTQALAALDAAGSPASNRDLVAERMKGRYDRWLPRVEPDLLGEQLIADNVVRPGLLPTVIDKVTSAGQRSRMLEVLLRMCGSAIGSVRRDARQALAGVLDDHLEELLRQAIAETAGNADPGPEARAMPSRLASCVELAATPQVAARALESVTFPGRLAVQVLAASVYVAAARDAEAREDLAAAAELDAKAAAAMTRVGQLEDAQASIDRAMVYLSTAPSMSVSQGKPLARVLSAGSLVSTGLSRPGVALETARRGARIVEELAAREPGAHDAQLLEVRLSLVVAYLTTGQVDDALETAQLAIAQGPADASLVRASIRVIQAQILQARGDLNAALDVVEAGIAEIPDAPGRPRSAELSALQLFRAALLSTLGRVEEASEAAQEAEEIALRGRAAGADDSDYVLAQIQIGAATVVLVTDAALALDMVAHASGALRTLLQRAPDVYGPYYALAETLHARILDGIGDAAGARGVALRADQLIRDGFATRPVLYLGALFMSALTLAEIHVSEDDLAAASKVLTDAHALLSRLEPSAVPLAEGNCAFLLRCLADVEMAHEDYGAAVLAARRALDAFNALIVRQPTAEYLLGRVGTRLLLLTALGAADRDEELMVEAGEALADAERLMARMPSDQSRGVLGLARVIVAGGYDKQGKVEEATALLKITLDDLHFDHETSATEDDRDSVRQLIRELEAPGDRAASDASPEKFEDLVPLRHSVILGKYHGTEIAARPFRPVLVLGPQRSRKTTGVIIPALLEWQGPVLVTSVRDDVVMGSILRREQMGGRSWVFEPFGDLFSGGSALTTWNPVDGCEDWETAVRMAHSLTESGHSREQSGVKDAEWWYSQATLLLGPLLHAAALSGLSMDAVSRWARTAEKAEVNARLEVVHAHSEAVRTFHTFSSLWDATRDGVYASLRNVLRAYESEAVRRNSKTGFRPHEFFNGQPNTLYLCAPPDEQELLAPIFTALIKTVVTHAYRYQGDSLNLLLLLDEAGNIARIDNLNTIATTAAGTKIQLVTVFHDLSQMEALYGPARASNIANNHSALLILPGSRDEATMHYADRLLRDESGPARFTAQRSVRQLKPGTALCVYEHLKIEEIALRSSTHDQGLIDLANTDGELSALVTPNRRDSLPCRFGGGVAGPVGAQSSANDLVVE
jgi:type IV secretion system protein VirD4